MGELLGALIPTFFISRLILWLTRKRDPSVGRIFFANGVSFLIAFTLGGLGFGEGTSFAWMHALNAYLLPQLVWLIVDLAMFGSKRRKAKVNSDTEVSGQ